MHKSSETEARWPDEALSAHVSLSLTKNQASELAQVQESRAPALSSNPPLANQRPH